MATKGYQDRDFVGLLRSRASRRVFAVLVVTFALVLVGWSFNFMRDEDAPKGLVTIVGLAVGVLGVWGLFWSANSLVSYLPTVRLQLLVQPYVFVGPAVVLLVIYLVFPAINTMIISLFDARSVNFVGLKNYVFVFTEPDVQIAFKNNIVWIVIVTSVSVCLGLVIAVLIDRVRYESIVKSLIFLPMAISVVGASVIWRFMYAWMPPQREQIGLLNAIVVALGGEPVGWLIERSINNIALMAIMIWLETGFSVVIMSAAVKGVPVETIEAARIDGANEIQVFFRVIIPQIQGTILTVATTIAIAVLRVFDIVFVMTSGKHGTEVLANRMYSEMFSFRNFGHGSALAVILLLAVIPIIFVNIRNLRRMRN